MLKNFYEWRGMLRPGNFEELLARTNRADL